MIYNIKYIKNNEIKEITTNLKKVTHAPNSEFLKDNMQECKFCKYKNICLKISIKNEDTEETKVSKQFLNEAIYDCCYYLNINSTSDVSVISVNKAFSQILKDEMENISKEC